MQKLYDLKDLEGEIWKDVVGFEGLYKVSNYSRVKSLKRTVINSNNNCKMPVKEIILKTTSDKYGYKFIFLARDSTRKLGRIHRVSATAFIPNPENKPFVNHIDGNKLNNHISNLEFVTAKENTQHALRTGLIKTGENRYNAKTTNEIAKQIRADYVYGKRGGFIEGSRLTRQMLADKYEVSFHVIKEILSNRTYHDPNFVKPN